VGSRPQKQFLSAVLASGTSRITGERSDSDFSANISRSSKTGGDSDNGCNNMSGSGLQTALSVPLQFLDDHFGDSSCSPYAIEKVAAARAYEARQLSSTYNEFPRFVPLSAGASHGNIFIGRRAAHGHHTAPVPFSSDLFASGGGVSARSVLVQTGDFVPAVRQAEFRALHAAFQRLAVSYSSGVNVSSNPAGPRVIFLHGEAGVGAQEYAKFVLHNFLLPLPPPPASSAMLEAAESFGEAALAAAAAVSPSARGYGATSAPSYTNAYRPFHFAFSRFSQAEFHRPRREGLLDSLQRRFVRGSSRAAEQAEAARRGKQSGGGSATSSALLGDSEGGSAIISTVADAAMASAGVHHTGPSSAAAAAAAAAASSSRSSVPSQENERRAPMCRLRVDGLAVAKALLGSALFLCSAAVGGMEVENASYPSEASVWDKYRSVLLDAPNIVLLSNVHGGDEHEVERLLFRLPRQLLHAPVPAVQTRTARFSSCSRANRCIR
jgi:hypothetical protein